MDTANCLIQLIEDKQEILENCNNIKSPQFSNIVRECAEVYLNKISDKLFQKDYNFKINAAIDYLKDELNTGHWSKVPASLRYTFSSTSFIKTIIVLQNNLVKSEEILKEAIKTIDMGLLLGGHMEKNTNLLTNSAKILTEELNKINQQNIHSELISNQYRKGTKRKRISDTQVTQKAFDNLNGIIIDEVSCPSLEQFRTLYFQTEIPVKLKGCIGHWNAVKRWSDFNYLVKVAGNRTVPIEIGSHYLDGEWSQSLMTFRQFLEDYVLKKSEQMGYLAQHNLFDQIPELKDDIRVPDYCAISRDIESSEEEPVDINAWLGPEGTVSPLHYDPKDNLLAQVFGSKQILLYSPNDLLYLHPHGEKMLSNTACVDPIKPDLVKYPDFVQASMFKCFLEAGDILYIPKKWWHHVTSLEASFSVSFWWK